MNRSESTCFFVIDGGTGHLRTVGGRIGYCVLYILVCNYLTSNGLPNRNQKTKVLATTLDPSQCHPLLTKREIHSLIGLTLKKKKPFLWKGGSYAHKKYTKENFAHSASLSCMDWADEPRCKE